jgi:hypothetical protein
MVGRVSDPNGLCRHSALLVGAGDRRVAPFLPQRALFRRQFELGFEIGETPGGAGIPFRAKSLMLLVPLRLRLVRLRGRSRRGGLREGDGRCGENGDKACGYELAQHRSASPSHRLAVDAL